MTFNDLIVMAGNNSRANEISAINVTQGKLISVLAVPTAVTKNVENQNSGACSEKW